MLLCVCCVCVVCVFIFEMHNNMNFHVCEPMNIYLAQSLGNIVEMLKAYDGPSFRPKKIEDEILFFIPLFITKFNIYLI
jgi:hypothetical protein